MFRSSYRIKEVTSTKIEIIDLDGDKSVTNDAENVVEELVKNHGNKKIFCRDTYGERDELCHNNGKFTGFKLTREKEESN